MNEEQGPKHDPVLFCGAFKKHRFYLFSIREPDDKGVYAAAAPASLRRRFRRHVVLRVCLPWDQTMRSHVTCSTRHHARKTDLSKQKRHATPTLARRRPCTRPWATSALSCSQRSALALWRTSRACCCLCAWDVGRVCWWHVNGLLTPLRVAAMQGALT